MKKINLFVFGCILGKLNYEYERKLIERKNQINENIINQIELKLNINSNSSIKNSKLKSEDKYDLLSSINKNNGNNVNNDNNENNKFVLNLANKNVFFVLNSKYDILFSDNTILMRFYYQKISESILRKISNTVFKF